MSLKLILIATAASTLAVASVPAARAMDLNAMNDAFNARLNAQMAATQNGIIQSNLNDPQVMAAYRAGVCGYGLTPQQFAYKWAATAGCTPQGYQNYMASEAANAQNEAAAVQRYRYAQQQRADAQTAYMNDYSRIQYERGLMNGGYYTQYTPNGYYWYHP